MNLIYQSTYGSGTQLLPDVLIKRKIQIYLIYIQLRVTKLIKQTGFLIHRYWFTSDILTVFN